MCNHQTFINAVPFGDEGVDVVCQLCGEINKELDNNIDHRFNLNHRVDKEIYDGLNENGYSIHRGLEKMFLPLTVQNNIRWYRDNFDKPLLNMYTVYGRLMRTCELYGIPRFYAKETMSKLLRPHITKKTKRKTTRGLYSNRIQIKTLIDTIKTDPRLSNRIPLLEELLKSVNGN